MGHLQTRGKHLQTRETPPNKGNPLQTRETPPNKGNTLKQGGGIPPNKGGDTSKQVENTTKREKIPFKQEKPQQARKRLSSKGYLPIKCKSLQVVGVSSQGKAVVSDGGYGVIGG